MKRILILFSLLWLISALACGCAKEAGVAYSAWESGSDVLDITARPTPIADVLNPAAQPTPASKQSAPAPASDQSTPTAKQAAPGELAQLEGAAGYALSGGVNLRIGPDTGFAVLTVIDRHDPLIITGKSGEWYRVEHAKGEGYLSGEFVALGAAPTPAPTPKPYTVKKLSSKTAYVNAKEVNFRAGPDTSYPIRKTAARYDKVTITGHSGDWYRLRYQSETGYMLKRYVSVGISPANYESVGRFDNEDVLLLAQIAYRESAKGSVKGYQAVASVVLNRVKSKKYPNTIEKVVFQGGGAQFSPARSEEKLRLTIPTKECVKAVREVLKDGSMLPANVMYFRTASRGKQWASSRKYFDTIGGNCFFT